MSNPDRRVTLLAFTSLTEEAEELLERDYFAEKGDGYVSPADHLAEIAGRQCYESWSRPNPATAANRDYLANVIRQNHTSVLAHASFTFRLTGVSRDIVTEIIRSRFLAFSQLSSRYVSMDDSYTVVPPALRGGAGVEQFIATNHANAVDDYNRLVDQLIENGATRKQAREAARCVLPGGTNTALIMSGNVRALRDFIVQRNSMHADPAIREIAQEILAILRDYCPNSVQDLSDEPAR